MTRALLASAFGCCAALASFASARAQSSDAEAALAREQFEAGVRAADSGEWEQARALFTRAYELDAQPLILVNIAAAEAHTGRLVASAATYRRFLRDRSDPRGQQYREAAERALQDLEARIPRARLRSSGVAASDVVSLDGRRLRSAALGLAVPVDPGAHVVTVERGGRIIGRAELVAVEREVVDVELELDQLGVDDGNEGPGGAGQTRHDHDTTFWQTPWFWIGIGAAAVVIAVVVGIVVATSGGSNGQPTVGTFGPGRFVLP